MQDWKEQETTLYGTPHIAYVYSVLHEASVEYPVGLKVLHCDRYRSVVVPASGARWRKRYSEFMGWSISVQLA